MEIFVNEEDWTIELGVPFGDFSLSDITEGLRVIDSAIPDIGNLLAKHENAEKYGRIQFKYIGNDGTCLLEGDAAPKLCAREELHPAIEKILRDILDYELSQNKPLWATDVDPLGIHLGFEMASRDPRYIGLYGDLLTGMDNNHEVQQEAHIDALVERYGLSSGIIRLLAIRLTVATGQHGRDQVSHLKDRICSPPSVLRDFLSHAEGAISDWKERFSDGKWRNEAMGMLSALYEDFPPSIDGPLETALDGYCG